MGTKYYDFIIVIYGCLTNRQLLGSPNTGPGSAGPEGGIPQWRRKRSEQLMAPRINRDESFTDGDDEILESLVKSATKSTGPRRTPRERKRIRQTDRKSREFQFFD